MRFFCVFVLMASLSAAIAWAQNADTVGTLLPKDLVGVYSIVSSENGGKSVAAQKIDGVIVRFTEDKIVTTDTDKKEIYAATYELDSAQHPGKIRMVSTVPAYKGAKANGLIAREGKMTKLIYRLPDGKEDPTEFKTKPGQIMVVMERIEQ